MTESISLYQDLQQNRFYLLNNTTGMKTKVNSNTDYVKEFDSALTGQVGYSERVEYATSHNKPGYMPLKIDCLNPPKNSFFYTPQCDKFEGYSQFPQPRTQPYYNQSRDLQSDPNKREEITKQRQLFRPESSDNSGLFEYKGLKKSNVGVPHLTNTMKEHMEFSSSQKVKVMGERSITRFQEMVKQFPDLTASTKMINGRLILAPSDSQIEKHKKSQILDKLLKDKTLLHEKVSNQQAATARWDYIQPLEKEKSTLIQTFIREKDSRDRDHEHFAQASQFYKVSTFDGKSFSSNTRPQTTQMKSENEFKRELVLQQQQLEAFKIPQRPEKSRISTKGRFNIKIQSIKNQYGQDRQIMMLLNPEMFNVTEDPKKQKQEEVRRNANRLKEQEGLERNLRNKL